MMFLLYCCQPACCCCPPSRDILNFIGECGTGGRRLPRLRPDLRPEQRLPVASNHRSRGIVRAGVQHSARYGCRAAYGKHVKEMIPMVVKHSRIRNLLCTQCTNKFYQILILWCSKWGFLVKSSESLALHFKVQIEYFILFRFIITFTCRLWFNRFT